MSVGKSLVAFMAICCLAILIVGCTGDQGPDGPPGYTGDDGTPGLNRAADPIADRTFGILIANGNASDIVGAPQGSAYFGHERDSKRQLGGCQNRNQAAGL